MAKLNILKIPIVLKIKQIQNLEKDEAMFEQYVRDGHYSQNPELDLGFFMPPNL